jgi:hypothetical protein
MVVIPAKAGIHVDLAQRQNSKMDSRLRGNDGKEIDSKG